MEAQLIKWLEIDEPADPHDTISNLENQVIDLEERVKELEDDNLKLALALAGMEQDYAVVRTKLGIYGR